MLACVALCSGVTKTLPRRFQSLLNVVMQAGQKLRQRPAHLTISSHVFAPSAAVAAAFIFAFSAASRSSEIILFVFAGSTTRALTKLSRRYSKTFHTLPDNVSCNTCHDSAS